MVDKLVLKRGERHTWIKGYDRGGVAVAFSYDTIIKALRVAGHINLHEGEYVDRIIADERGLTFYIEDEE